MLKRMKPFAGWMSSAMTLVMLIVSCRGGAEMRLRADNIGYSSNFGRSVAVSGGTAIVGAPSDDYQGSDAAGAAYIFELHEGRWQKTERLAATYYERSDHFGWSVAIDYDTAVIGAKDATGLVQNGGAAYVFQRTIGNRWYQQRKLVSPNTRANDDFGKAVAINGDTIIVGAPNYDAHSGSRASCGGAWIFVRSNPASSSWTQQRILLPPDLGANDYFGSAVALTNGGNVAVVGAYGHGSGAVYIFRRQQTTWTRISKLTCPSGGSCSRFGFSVDVSGNRLIVGDPLAASNNGKAWWYTLSSTYTASPVPYGIMSGGAGRWTGYSVAISGDRSVVSVIHDDKCGTNCGEVLIRDDGVPPRYVRPSDGARDDNFGYSVAISGNNIIVGAPFHDSTATLGGAAYGYFVEEPSSSASALNAVAGGSSSPSQENSGDLVVRISASGGGFVAAGLCLCGCMIALALCKWRRACASLFHTETDTDKTWPLDVMTPNAAVVEENSETNDANPSIDEMADVA